MKAPRLSVVLANKNRSQQLEHTLRHWRMQRGPGGAGTMGPDEIELIVVDDGSTVVPNVCERYDCRLILNQGGDRKNPSVAWNVGLRLAKGAVRACTHAEIIPSHDCGRYLYGACMGDEQYLAGLRIWAPVFSEQGMDERIIHEPHEFDRMKHWAIRANVIAYRLRPQDAGAAASVIDPDDLQNGQEFWTFHTDFGGHSNAQIRDIRGFFWNNLFALRAETWAWINYMRESRDWGMDDEDFQRRNQLLKLAYLFTDDAHCYHQWHGAEFRGPSDDHMQFDNLYHARLVQRFPETADAPFALDRGDFWGNA